MLIHALNMRCKYNTWTPRSNDVEKTVSTSFQRGIHVVCLSGAYRDELQPQYAYWFYAYEKNGILNFSLLPNLTLHFTLHYISVADQKSDFPFQFSKSIF